MLSSSLEEDPSEEDLVNNLTPIERKEKARSAAVVCNLLVSRHLATPQPSLSSVSSTSLEDKCGISWHADLWCADSDALDLSNNKLNVEEEIVKEEEQKKKNSSESQAPTPKKINIHLCQKKKQSIIFVHIDGTDAKDFFKKSDAK